MTSAGPGEFPADPGVIAPKIDVEFTNGNPGRRSGTGVRRLPPVMPNHHSAIDPAQLRAGSASRLHYFTLCDTRFSPGAGPGPQPILYGGERFVRCESRPDRTPQLHDLGTISSGN